MTATGEPRMLIGELVLSESHKTFDKVNPTTGDRGRAIGAARRAFDETDWSTNRALRTRCDQ